MAVTNDGIVQVSGEIRPYLATSENPAAVLRNPLVSIPAESDYSLLY